MFGCISLLTHQFQAEPCRWSRGVALFSDLIERVVNRLLMLRLISLTAPPSASPVSTAPHNSLNYCVVSVRYKRLSYLMLRLSSRYQRSWRLNSEGHLARVGFPCSLELTGNLTGNISVFELVRVVIPMPYWGFGRWC